MHEARVARPNENRDHVHDRARLLDGITPIEHVRLAVAPVTARSTICNDLSGTAVRTRPTTIGATTN